MATKNIDSNMVFEPTEIDEDIIDHLVRVGNDVPANIADDVGQSRQYVHQRLQLLGAAGLVENIGRGVYRFTGNMEETDR